MRKLIFSLYFLTSFIFISCDSDSNSDPKPSNPVTNNNGDYWPTAINNVWNYSGKENESHKIISTELINNKQYYKFDLVNESTQNGSLTGNTFLRKESGNYIYRYGQFNINANGIIGTTTPFEFIILKDNIDVNQTWSDKYKYSVTTTYDFNGTMQSYTVETQYKGTILAKNIKATVENKIYDNVIKINIEQKATSQGQVDKSNTEYWFAKDIGLIKIISNSVTQNLSSYTLN